MIDWTRPDAAMRRAMEMRRAQEAKKYKSFERPETLRGERADAVTCDEEVEIRMPSEFYFPSQQQKVGVIKCEPETSTMYTVICQNGEAVRTVAGWWDEGPARPLGTTFSHVIEAPNNALVEIPPGHKLYSEEFDAGTGRKRLYLIQCEQDNSERIASV